MKKFRILSTKRKISFVIFSLLTLFIVWFIFSHSAKPASESSMDSEGLSAFVAVIINFLFKTSLTSENTVGSVRTFAHFSEFGALSFFISGSLVSFFGENKSIFLKVFIPTLFIAVADETIQLFFDGRAFQFSDIIVDSLGGIAGIVCFALMIKLFFKKNRTDKKHQN